MRYCNLSGKGSDYKDNDNNNVHNYGKLLVMLPPDQQLQSFFMKLQKVMFTSDATKSD